MMFVSEDLGTMNGPGRSGDECIRSQKESMKKDIALISHWIWSLLQLFFFAIAPNFNTHPTHASVKQSEQIRHQSKGI